MQRCCNLLVETPGEVPEQVPEPVPKQAAGTYLVECSVFSVQCSVVDGQCSSWGSVLSGGQQTPPSRLLGSVGENVKFAPFFPRSFHLAEGLGFARQGTAEASRVIFGSRRSGWR